MFEQLKFEVIPSILSNVVNTVTQGALSQTGNRGHQQ